MTSAAPANPCECVNPSNASARLEVSLYLHQFPSSACPFPKPSRGCPADHATVAHGWGTLSPRVAEFDPTPRECRGGFIESRRLATNCMNDEQQAGGSLLPLGRCDQPSKDRAILDHLRHRCGRSWRWHVPMQRVACSHLDSEFAPCCASTGIAPRMCCIGLGWV
jgi:hypothetical protein